MNRLDITPGFVLLLAYLTFHDDMFIMLVTAALLHELAHAAATLLQGGDLISCRLSASGAFIRAGGLSYGREAAAVAAGPIASITAAVIGARLGFGMFAGVSLALGLVNLLPARELDGGRLVELLLSRRGGSPRGVMGVLTVLSALALAAPLAIGFYNGIRNYTLAVFVLYLLFGELYGLFTHARAKARAVHGRRAGQRY
ncbi:MAG: M50 family metallopeptidase [Oscillospiraceae bacterium]|nr:M50 family metallopeptidase [Oscillospiraceae bacterium]